MNEFDTILEAIKEMRRQLDIASAALDKYVDINKNIDERENDNRPAHKAIPD